jgi:hypothetical protein
MERRPLRLFRPECVSSAMTANSSDCQPLETKPLSYRRMYLVAEHAATNACWPRDVRRTASRVVRLLGPVIDQPIAPAARLAESRRQFEKLVNVFSRHGRSLEAVAVRLDLPMRGGPEKTSSNPGDRCDVTIIHPIAVRATSGSLCQSN